ncbi:hypothetical protein ACOMHN_037831 [Nucella lapillus]
MVVDEPEQIMEHMKTINHLMKKTKPCWIEDAMSRMPVRLAELGLFLTCCHQCHNYEAFTLAALFHNRLDTITSFKGSSIVDCLEDAFWTDLLTFLASQEKWSCIKKLLMHSSRPPCAKLCELLMDVSLNEDSLELLQFLLDSMSHFDVPLLKNMLASALRCGRSQQFKMLYLVTKTADSKPSSLLDLSLQEVSRMVGWGHVREPNVQRLPVPDPLKEMLAFKQFEACAICDKIIAIDHSCKQ